MSQQKPEGNKFPSGWYFPAYANTNKFHYNYDKDRSVCGKFGTFGSTIEDFSKKRPAIEYTCKACLKKYFKLEENAD